MAMTCPDCGTNLDNVPVGDPSPKGGAMRRDTTVTASTAAAFATVWPDRHSDFMLDEDPANPAVSIGQAVELTVSMNVDAVIAPAPVELPDGAWRRLEDLATKARKLQVWLHPPGEDGRVLCEVMDDDGILLGAETGADGEDAVLNVADVIAGTAKDGSAGNGT